MPAVFACLFVLPVSCRPDTGFVEDSILPVYGVVEAIKDTLGIYDCQENPEGIISYEVFQDSSCLIRSVNEDGSEGRRVVPLGDVSLPEGVKRKGNVEYLPGEDALTDNICRGWRISSTFVTVKSKAFPTVGTQFDGFLLADFFSFMDKYGMSMKRVKIPQYLYDALGAVMRYRKEYDEGYSSLEVENLLFSHDGTFVVNLVDREPFVGSWRWENREEKYLSASFGLEGEQKGVSVPFNAYVSFNGEGICISVDAAFTSKGHRTQVWIDLLCPLEAV